MDETGREYIVVVENTWIEPELYERIRLLLPIPCVDLLIHGNRQVMLLKRVNEPAKGEWFSPGGRILLGESLEDAVHRKAKQELGVDVDVWWQVGSYNFIFTAPDGRLYHTPTTYFVVTLTSSLVKMDNQHSDFKWFSADEIGGLHPFIARVVRDSRILELGW